MHNKEEWNAGITNMTVREEDAHDRDPVRQGQVSAFPFTSFVVASESFASQLCLPTALTHGRFASSLCLCLCLFLFLFLFLPLKLGAIGSGLRSSAPRGCSMARVAADHPHVNGNKPVTGHRLSL